MDDNLDKKYLDDEDENLEDSNEFDDVDGDDSEDSFDDELDESGESLEGGEETEGLEGQPQSKVPLKKRLNNLADSKKKEGQEKLDKAKKMVDDGQKKSDALKKQGDRINKLRSNLGDDPNKNKFAKSMLDKAAKSNAAKQKKQEEQNKSTAEKAAKLAKDGKKLVESGTKLAADIASGNVAGIAKDALELAKNDLFKKAVKYKIRIIACTVAVSILILLVILSAVLEPISDAMERIREGANVAEKVHNFIHGLGYGDSVNAFYEELDFLESHYEGELDEPLLMATLFYDDALGKGSTLKDEASLLSSGLNDDSLGWYAMLISSLSTVAQESVSERNEADGIVYSTNKIFRLMQLSKAMMSKGEGVTGSVPFDDYFGMSADQMDADAHKLFQSLIAVLLYPLLSTMDIFTELTTTNLGFFVLNPVVQVTAMQVMAPLAEKGYISSDLANMSLENFYTNLSFLFEDFFTMFTDIQGFEIVIRAGDESVSLNIPDENLINLIQDLKTLKGQDITDEEQGIIDIDADDLSDLIDDGVNLLCGASDTLADVATFIFSIGPDDLADFDIDVNITYKKYSLDIDQYKEYLKNDYLRKMPEFRKHLSFDSNGDPTEKSLDALVEDIITLSDVWKEIYGDDEDSARSNGACIGDIRQSVLNQLSLPVHLDVGTIVNFDAKSAFGANGRMHNGVDLNLDTVGVDVGSPVFSIYEGDVIESTASGNYSSTINGGGVKIQYTITYDPGNDSVETESTSVFIAEYEGLDPTSVPHTGDHVTQDQQIGVIGADGFSETGTNAGLHFGIYDNNLQRYLNPVNMFITCFTDDDDIPLVQTNELSVHELGISKTNFKTAVARYIIETDNTILKTWDLDLVYDVSRANNVNPELVVIRAIVEGFSPYSKGYQEKNNYWGIGCYNGAPLSRCTSYSSFSEGIAGFANLSSVKNSETIVDMMMSYVNIGSYWWKPGDSGAGGCYYFEAEQKYMSKAEVTRVSQACLNPSYVCNENNKAGCLATNQEDQRAHAAYNCEAMNTLFQRIFANYHVASPIDRNLDDVDESLSSLPGNACAEDDCIIDTDLESFLTARGSSVEKFNTEITRAKNQAGGSCTRNGAVAIAKKTLDYMKGKGAKLPYYWGGGWGDKISGAQAIWGAGSEAGCGKYGGNNGNIWYPQCGLDCAGFVRWVLNTDGYSLPAHEANNFGQGFLPGAVNVELANVQLLKAGDIMFSGGHVVFIVGVDKANSRYIIAEAGGKTVGIQYSTKSFNASGYTGVNMDGFYTAPQACLQ